MAAYYDESPYLIEVVCICCAVPPIVAFRLMGARSIGPAETFSWLLLLWALASCVRTWVKRRRLAPHRKSA